MSARPTLTHFVCVPLINAASRPLFEASLRRFHADLSAHPAVAGLAQSRAVRPVGSIHLTLGVMSLTTPDRVNAAMSFLSTLDVIGILREVAHTLTPEERQTQCPLTQPDDNGAGAACEDLSIRLSVRGIEARPPADRTSVLWVPVSHPLLSHFCLRVRQRFQDAGFLLPETRPLKLHATVFNTLYAKARGRGRRGGVFIDARDVIREMDGRVWADNITLDRVAICEMGSQQVKDGNGKVVDEAYTEIAVKCLPTR